MTITVTLACLVIQAMHLQPLRRQGCPFLVVDRPVQQLEICDAFAMVTELLNPLVVNTGSFQPGRGELAFGKYMVDVGPVA